MKDQFDLSEKCVLITGAAGGIGTVMTKALLRAGAGVLAADISDDALGKLKSAIADAGLDANLLHGAVCQVADEQDCKNAVSAAVDRFGGIDLLINNAGISFRFFREDYLSNPIKFWDMPVADWQRIMDTNTRGTFVMSRAAMPQFLSQPQGKILNVTTGLQNMMRLGSSPYGSSKAAIEAASGAWTKDVAGTNITINTIEPGGAVDTWFIPDDPKVDRDALTKPEVMERPACWFASSQSDGINGFRFVAADWDTGLSASDAALANRQPIGWPDAGHAVMTGETGVKT